MNVVIGLIVGFDTWQMFLGAMKVCRDGRIKYHVLFRNINLRGSI